MIHAVAFMRSHWSEKYCLQLMHKIGFEEYILYSDDHYYIFELKPYQKIYKKVCGAGIVIYKDTL